MTIHAFDWTPRDREHPVPVILDGDPGHDDALAWMAAAQSPLIDIKAVTTVAGNKDIANVTQNALNVCSLCGIEAPIAQGARGPLVVPGITAGDFHGKTGLDGADLPPAYRQLADCSAVDLMVKILEESPEPVVIIGTGAETNLAALLLYRPDLKSRIRAFHLMGGGIEHGNWNPAAEFNILVDPEAAEIVFNSGVPIVMAGLDVTERALVYPVDVDRIRALQTHVSHIVGGWLDFFGGTHAAMGYEGWPLHDPCAVLSLVKPELFTIRKAKLQVCTEGLYTRGMTTADFEAEDCNGAVIMDVDREAFIEELIHIVDQTDGKYEEGAKRYSAKLSTDNLASGSIPSAGSTATPMPPAAMSPASLADYKKLLQETDVTLLLTDGPEEAALAFQVWPALADHIGRIIYAGGTCWRGDATPFAEKSIYQNPKAMETLLNTRVPVVFCTLESAQAHNCTTTELAIAVAEKPAQFTLRPCGIHIETLVGSPVYGKLICDLNSDQKFEKKNAYLVD